MHWPRNPKIGIKDVRPIAYSKGVGGCENCGYGDDIVGIFSQRWSCGGLGAGSVLTHNIFRHLARMIDAGRRSWVRIHFNQNANALQNVFLFSINFYINSRRYKVRLDLNISFYMIFDSIPLSVR